VGFLAFTWKIGHNNKDKPYIKGVCMEDQTPQERQARHQSPTSNGNPMTMRGVVHKKSLGHLECQKLGTKGHLSTKN